MGHWICEVCKAEITPTDAGAILVYNTNPEYGAIGTHPVGPTVNPPEPEFMQLGSKESWDYLEAARNAVSIGFSVAHTRCKHSPEGPYFVDPERASTMEAWAGWVWHVGSKTWMGKDDVLRMLGFWWTHKGDGPPWD